MPASSRARVTAAAVSSIWGARPISSGAKSRVRPMPMASRGPDDGAAAASRQNTRRCGDSPPSVPPDITIATRFSISESARPSFTANSIFSARVA
jgi:hypothetical protein